MWAPAPTRGPAPSTAAVADIASRRALGAEIRSSSGPDFGLLLASLAAVGAALLAWRAIGDPWVRLAITDTSDRLNPTLIGTIPLKGQAALVGMIGQALAGVIGAYGVFWFLYSFDRGSTIPWFMNPAISIAAAAAGLVLVVLSAAVWFVWTDAAVEHARVVRDDGGGVCGCCSTPSRSPWSRSSASRGSCVSGAAMVAGLFASSVAWWAYRKRG